MKNINSLKEIQLKNPNTCEYYKEVGCIKDVCTCYTLVSKQETLEEAAERYSEVPVFRMGSPRLDIKRGFELGANWQQERSYSEEEVMNILKERDLHNSINMGGNNTWIDRPEWFEKFKKK